MVVESHQTIVCKGEKYGKLNNECRMSKVHLERWIAGYECCSADSSPQTAGFGMTKGGRGVRNDKGRARSGRDDRRTNWKGNWYGASGGMGGV